MAILKNNVLGPITGKIGNLVIRELNGKLIVSNRPPKYKPCESPRAKSNRNRFAVTVKFAKYINSIDTLAQTWRIANVNGTSSFNRILKYNIQHSDNSYPTVNNIITPPGYFIDIENLILKNDYIEFTFAEDVITFSKNSTHGKISFFIVMVFLEPKDLNLDAFKIDHSVIVKDALAKDIIINFTKIQQKILDSYTSINLYFTEVVEFAKTKDLLWSSTVCKTLLNA